ncbi:MAG TPA: universal stress protein [Chthoniobacterales bacterium]|nr:universal stress protein [Chthoniobacterales bacterium]
MKTMTAEMPEPTAAAKERRTGVGVSSARDRFAPIKIKNILVALDFSPAAMQAFDYAMTLATELDAKIDLMHVQAPDEACALPGAAHALRECAETATLIQKRLGHLSGEAPPQFWPENCRIRTGHPYEEICKLAGELSSDLIVLGSRGNTGLKRVVLGSTAERVVRFAPCPVLVVRKWKRGDLRIRNILVPTDFSHCAMAGATYGATLAKKLNAKLRLFNVVFPISPALIERVAMNLPIDNTLQMRDARLDMEVLSKRELFEDVACEGVVRSGYITDMICGETDNADLVVISTHGRTGFRHALMGSIAEQVVRYAECPVLVVPSHYAFESK